MSVWTSLPESAADYRNKPRQFEDGDVFDVELTNRDLISAIVVTLPEGVAEVLMWYPL